MPYQKQPILLPIMGLNTGSPAEYIDNRATPECKNIQIRRNVIEKRYGTTALGTTLGEEIMLIRELYRETIYWTVRAGLTKVEYYNEGTSAWVDITGTALTGASSDIFSSATPLYLGQRVLVFSNGVDDLRIWDTLGNVKSLKTLGDTPPNPMYMTEHSAYLVLANVEDGGNKYKSRVQWCDTSDITIWNSGNAGYVDLLEDGNDITGHSLYGNYVCVHKQTAIYLGYLVPTEEVYRFDRKNTGVGTICNNTIQNVVTGEQIFLARDGIHAFNGNSAPLIASELMDEIRESLNPEYVHKCWSITVPELNEYWVAVPIGSQTTPDTIYKFNYMTRQVHKDIRTGMTSIGKMQRTTFVSWDDFIHAEPPAETTWDEMTGRWDDSTLLTLEYETVFGDNTGITTKKSSIVNNDNGVAISAYWESKDYEVEEKGRLGQWLEMQYWALGNNVKIEYSINSGNSWTGIGTYALTSDYPPDDTPLYAYFDVVSSKIRFRFSNETINETFSLKQFIIKYRSREMRQ